MCAGSTGTRMAVRSLIVCQRHLERPHKELLERQRAHATLLRERDAGVIDQQQGPRIGVRLGEAEVAAERPDFAHTHIGHVRCHLGQGGEMGPDHGRTFERPMGRNAPRCAVLHPQAQCQRDQESA